MRETRQITQTKIFLLVLNPMEGNTETSNIVAVCFDKEKMIKWYTQQLSPTPYLDNDNSHFHSGSHEYRKVFQKGSLLEWYNPVDNKNFTPNHRGQGIIEDWIIEEELASHYYLIPD